MNKRLSRHCLVNVALLVQIPLWGQAATQQNPNEPNAPVAAQTQSKTIVAGGASIDNQGASGSTTQPQANTAQNMQPTIEIVGQPQKPVNQAETQQVGMQSTEQNIAQTQAPAQQEIAGSVQQVSNVGQAPAAQANAQQTGVQPTETGAIQSQAPAEQPVAIGESVTAQEQPAQSATPQVETEQKPTQEKTSEPDYIAQSQAQFDEGIDTLDEEDSGNWYLKRSTWKKAKPKYEEIRKIVSRIEKTIELFLKKRKAIETISEQFFFEVGLDQGELTQIVAEILDAQRKKAAQNTQKLTEEQKLEEQQLAKKRQEALAKLKNYLDVIKKTDDNLMDAIFNSLIEQQQNAQSYEEKALDNYYKISEILDDKKARELLSQMDTYKENVLAIEQWINGPLTQYVDQSSQRMKDLMQKTHALIADLKAQGIEIKRKQTEAELKEQEARRKADAEKLAKAQAEARAALKKKGFTYYVTSFFNSLVDLVMMPINYILSFFTSSSGTSKNSIKS